MERFFLSHHRSSLNRLRRACSATGHGRPVMTAQRGSVSDLAPSETSRSTAPRSRLRSLSHAACVAPKCIAEDVNERCIARYGTDDVRQGAFVGFVTCALYTATLTISLKTRCFETHTAWNQRDCTFSAKYVTDECGADDLFSSVAQALKREKRVSGGSVLTQETAYIPGKDVPRCLNQVSKVRQKC